MSRDPTAGRLAPPSPLMLLLLLLLLLSRVGALRPDELFPYGESRGDQLLPEGDDESSAAVKLAVPLRFYDAQFSDLYVGTNGIISTQDFPRETQYVDDDFPTDFPAIAPFLADIDTSHGRGRILYREDTSPAVLGLAARYVRTGFPRSASSFTPTHAFLATWEHVGAYEEVRRGAAPSGEWNTFQAVLASDGSDTYALFLYPADGLHETWGASTEPPPTPTHLTKRQVKQKVESLTTQLQVMTTQRNDLRDRLILVTEGSLDNRPYHRPNPFYEHLKKEHQQVMLDLQNFKNENMEASQKLNELTKEKVFLCDLQSRLLMEQSQLKKKVDMLRQEKKQQVEEWVLLKHHLDELKVLCEDQEESSDLQTQQQQEQERMEERLQSLLKQRELVTQQKHLAMKLQHHLTVSQMRSEKLLHELEQPTAQDESLLPTELLQQEH